MQGFDVNRFVRERTPRWRALEATLARVEIAGMRCLDIDDARDFGELYRGAADDLVRARSELVDASVSDYLNDLVARAYAVIYAQRPQERGRLVRFLLREYPALVRSEWKAILLSTLIFLGGGVFGAAAAVFDPSAMGVVMPEQHQTQTAHERVAREEAGDSPGGHQAVAFSSFLFTNNIKVTFLVFALGITFGLGSVAVLFLNGVPLGALAVEYHQAGEGLFFWAWILPHGVPELTVIFIAGGAGLVLARGLWLPGRRRRRDAVVAEGRTAAKLVLGGMPLLVIAGVIEGTISQIHEPTIPYGLKLLFAVFGTVGLYSWLGLAGREES